MSVRGYRIATLPEPNPGSYRGVTAGRYSGDAPHCGKCALRRACMASVKALGPMLDARCEGSWRKPVTISPLCRELLTFLREHGQTATTDVADLTQHGRSAVWLALCRLLAQDLVRRTDRDNTAFWEAV